VRADARLRLAGGRDLLERAAGRRGLRPAAHDPAQRHLRRPVPPPGRRGPPRRPRPVGRGDPDHLVGIGNWAGTKRTGCRPGVPCGPPTPTPRSPTPAGAAVTRRTCFPRLPCPLGLGRTAQAVLRAEVVLLERPPAPSCTSSVFAS